MARLIPKTPIDEISLKPERDVARALVEQLPDDCIVYHSYPWLKAERNYKSRSVTLREGETDFVIVSPKFGMLILEVKGGEIFYDADNWQWYRRLNGGRIREIQDPFEQVRRNAHYLEDRIREESFAGHDKIPCPYGYAVVFPDCVYSGKAPPGADTSLILSANDLQNLGQKTLQVLGKWRRTQNPIPLAKEQLDGIVKALSPVFQLLPVLFRQIEEQEERLFRLTEEQLRLLDFLNMHDRAAVHGVAGSGKTLLARAQAQRFADDGKRSLLVCYNKALAEWLRSTMPECYVDKITVRHFHGLCSDWCRKARIQFKPPRDYGDQFWKYKAPDLLAQAVDHLPDRFDAVVVDEGQDFYPDWWWPLEVINSDGDTGPFYVFFDPAQNLFVDEDLAIPDLGKPYELPTNCRNTRKIAAVCGRIRGIDIRTREDAPEGVMCDIKFAPTAENQQRLCQEYLSEWIGRGKLKPKQVAILSPHDKARSSLARTKSIAKTPITLDPSEWQTNGSILFATVRSFKGLEADAVIMLDVLEPGTVPYFSTADFYVGCSRAKHLLSILLTKKGIL